MKKIILIEDRPGRQAQFLSANQIGEIEDIKSLSIPKETECRTLIDKINSNYAEGMNTFSLIIVHKSSLNQQGLRALENLCKSKKIDLIIFSGSISQLVYFNENYQSLTLNSKDFYNNGLKLFLEKYLVEPSTSLLELVYREKWRLVLLMRCRLLKTIESLEEEEEYKIILEEELTSLENLIGISLDDVDKEINKTIASL